MVWWAFVRGGKRWSYSPRPSDGQETTFLGIFRTLYCTVLQYTGGDIALGTECWEYPHLLVPPTKPLPTCHTLLDNIFTSIFPHICHTLVDNTFTPIFPHICHKICMQIFPHICHTLVDNIFTPICPSICHTLVDHIFTPIFPHICHRLFVCMNLWEICQNEMRCGN